MTDILSLVIGTIYVGSIIALDEKYKRETFQNSSRSKEYFSQGQQPSQDMPVFYNHAQQKANALFDQQNNFQQTNVQSINKYAGPVGQMPQSKSGINMNAAGDQLLAYQMYQQAVNASTPTDQQLAAISGNSYQQTGNESPLQGGVSANYAPYNIIGSGPELYNSEYQAVNLNNPAAQAISECAQNAPSFLSTSLLPKPAIPGQDAWEISAPQDILASQNFLAAVQQIGTDTVMSSLRNASHDIRGNIPNPINVVSPWLNTSITPDLERKQLECFVPNNGIYGCGPAGANANGTYVGLSD